MKFEKGKSGNPNGRPEGAKNKITTELRDFLGGFLNENKEKFMQDAKKLDPFSFTKLYLESMQFVSPKLKQTEIKDTTTLEMFLNMSPEERTEIIKQLKKQL